MDQKFIEFEEALSNYHTTVSGKSAASLAAETEAESLVAQMHDLAQQRDTALLDGEDDQAVKLDQQIDDLTGKVRLLERRSGLLADQVAEHDPAAAVQVFEAGRTVIEQAQGEIAKRIAALEQKRDRYAREVEGFALFVRQVADVRRLTTTLMAQSGLGGEIRSFPRTHGYGPDGFMPRLSEGFDANVDVPECLYRNRPGVDFEATYGRPDEAETVFVPGSESLVPAMPTDRNLLTDEHLAVLEGPRWLQEV